MSDLSDDWSDCSESDDDSMDSADIVMLAESQRTPETKPPPIEPTVAPSIMHTSATSTSILIEFIRHDILSKLNHRRKKGPDLSQSILEDDKLNKIGRKMN